MTPKEKAFDLMNKFIKFHRNGIYNVVHEDIAKQYALIAVDEILEVLGEEGVYLYADSKFEIYYKEVKQEIEKL